MGRIQRFIAAALLLLCACASSRTPQVALDHAILYVAPGAPERAALEAAGLHAAPDVNLHEGQGTASITFEFENAFLELLWPDPNVPVIPTLQRAHEKFVLRSNWRTSGWSPIGIVLHRTGTRSPLPVPVWTSAPPWMEPGTAMEMLTPRDDTRSPSISVHPQAVTDLRRAPETLVHPAGVHRVTAVRLLAPPGYTPIDALRYVERQRVLTLGRGDQWTIELTFDGGSQGKERDFRPQLPLEIRY